MRKLKRSLHKMGLFAIVFAVSAGASWATGPEKSGGQEKETGMAKVVIYRPGSYFGAALRIKVKIGDMGTVKIRNRTITELEVPAGDSEFKVRFRKKENATLELKPGATYYMRGSVLPGWVGGKYQLVEVSERQGLKDLKTYKFRKKLFRQKLTRP